jgi:hypothetical protein
MKGNQFMKNQNPLTKLTLLLAMLLTLGATQTKAKILPVSISFAPVGITMDQTERLNLVSMDVLNGMLIRWSFIDASGVTLAQSTLILPLGKIVSIDFKRHRDPLPANADPAVQIRAEIRAKVDILTPNVPSESLRRSREVFNNDSEATTVCMGGSAP